MTLMDSVPAARRLVETLVSLGGDSRETLVLARRLTPAQWADIAEYVADVGPATDEVVALTLDMLDGRYRCDLTYDRRTCGNHAVFN